MRVVLANIVAIYRRELQSYFASPLAYVVAGVFWLLSGIFFVFILNLTIQRIAFADQAGFQGAIDAPYQFLQSFLGILSSIALFILPILSMSLYAEERKRGTLELLATSPVTNWAVAIGKLLAVVTFFITLLLPMLVYEFIVLTATNPPMSLPLILLGHLGLVLLAAAVLSLGMFVSSLTDSTILAAIFTFALMLFLWIVDAIGQQMGGTFGSILAHLSLLKHYGNLSQGILDTSSLVLFASYIFLGIFLTAQSVNVFRYQRS
ncbi:MAG: ABC transporter permease [Leptolyngbyaceae cyanobacterium bins.302]|nr:ABC transporter permease [Leptolyngbyaceae cyanobacterium bins.302]